MSDKNKIKYGLCNAYYAPLTEDDDGGVTYETPRPLRGAISISLTPSTFNKVLAADNTEYWTGTGITGYSGDLTMARVPDDFRRECLGEIVDETDDVSLETSDLNMSRFALLFQFEGDVKATRHVLYNCNATRPALGSQTLTPADGPDPGSNTEAITITASPRKADKYVKASTMETTPDRVYNSWFNSVWEPTSV